MAEKTVFRGEDVGVMLRMLTEWFDAGGFPRLVITTRSGEIYHDLYVCRIGDRDGMMEVVVLPEGKEAEKLFFAWYENGDVPRRDYWREIGELAIASLVA